MTQKITFAGFVEFVRNKGDELFNPDEPRECAMYQYMQSLGYTDHVIYWDYLNDGAGNMMDLDSIQEGLAKCIQDLIDENTPGSCNCGDVPFSELLERLEAL